MARRNRRNRVKVIYEGPKTKSGQGPAPRRRRGRRNNKGGMKNNNAMKHAELICQNANPWCNQAINAKLYDTNATPSLTYSNRQIFKVTTDGSGSAACAIIPYLSAIYQTGTVVGSTVTAWSGGTATTFVAQITSTGIDTNRIVTYGFKFVTTSAWTSATGLLIVNEVNGNFTSATGQPITSPLVGSRAEIYPVRDSKVTVIAKPTSANAGDYVPYNSLNAWTSYLLGFSGCPTNTDIGYVEVMINIEWLPKAYTGYVMLATAAAPNIPSVLEGRATVLSNVQTMFPTDNQQIIDNTFMSTALSALDTAYNVADQADKAYAKVNAISDKLGNLATGARLISRLAPMIM